MADPAASRRLIHDEEGAAEVLSTSPRRVADLRRAGLLPAIKDGRKFKYKHTDLMAYVASLPEYEPHR